MVMQTLTFIIPLQQVIGSSGDLPPPQSNCRQTLESAAIAGGSGKCRFFLSGKTTRSKNSRAVRPMALNIPRRWRRRRQDDILQIILQFYQRWFWRKEGKIWGKLSGLYKQSLSPSYIIHYTIRGVSMGIIFSNCNIFYRYSS